MELRQIQYFIQLYKDCNITKASQALFISQQGLSKSIGKLEEELDLLLFERNALGVVPTTAADKLYERFNDVLDSYNKLSIDVENIKKERVIKIAAPSGFSLSYPKDDFMKYSKLYPNVKTAYMEDDNRTLPSYLINKKAEVAFMIAPIPEECQSHHLAMQAQLYATVHKEHPLAKKDFIYPEDLEGSTFLFLNLYENFNSSILKDVNEKNISYTIYNKKANITEFLPLIYTYNLVGFSSKLHFQHYNFPEIVFIPLAANENFDSKCDIHLVTLKNSYIDNKLQQYIDYEKNIFHKDIF